MAGPPQRRSARWGRSSGPAGRRPTRRAGPPTSETRAPTPSRLRRMDRSIAACVAKVPAAQRKLVTTHDAFGYYARRYDIEVVGALIPSLSTQAQPSGRDVQRLVDQIRSERVEGDLPRDRPEPPAGARGVARGRCAGGAGAVGRHARAARLAGRHLPRLAGLQHRDAGRRHVGRPGALPARRLSRLGRGFAAQLEPDARAVAALDAPAVADRLHQREAPAARAARDRVPWPGSPGPCRSPRAAPGRRSTTARARSGRPRRRGRAGRCCSRSRW